MLTASQHLVFSALKRFVALTFHLFLLQVDLGADFVAVVFQHQTFRALDALQGLTDGVDLAAIEFQLGTLGEVGFRFVFVTKLVIGQAEEVVSTRIVGAFGNDGIEKLCRFQVVATVVSVHTATVQIDKDSVLSGCLMGRTCS